MEMWRRLSMDCKGKPLNNFMKFMTVAFLVSLFSVAYSQEKDIKILMMELKDPNQTVRWKASQALRKMGTSAIEFFIVALKDKDAAVREDAVFALGEIGDIRVVEPLIGALKDES